MENNTQYNKPDKSLRSLAAESDVELWFGLFKMENSKREESLSVLFKMPDMDTSFWSYKWNLGQCCLCSTGSHTFLCLLFPFTLRESRYTLAKWLSPIMVTFYVCVCVCVRTFAWWTSLWLYIHQQWTNEPTRVILKVHCHLWNDLCLLINS